MQPLKPFFFQKAVPRVPPQFPTRKEKPFRGCKTLPLYRYLFPQQSILSSELPSETLGIKERKLRDMTLRPRGPANSSERRYFFQQSVPPLCNPPPNTLDKPRTQFFKLLNSSFKVDHSKTSFSPPATPPAKVLMTLQLSPNPLNIQKGLKLLLVPKSFFEKPMFLFRRTIASFRRRPIFSSIPPCKRVCTLLIPFGTGRSQTGRLLLKILRTSLSGDFEQIPLYNLYWFMLFVS